MLKNGVDTYSAVPQNQQWHKGEERRSVRGSSALESRKGTSPAGYVSRVLPQPLGFAALHRHHQALLISSLSGSLSLSLFFFYPKLASRLLIFSAYSSYFASKAANKLAHTPKGQQAKVGLTSCSKRPIGKARNLKIKQQNNCCTCSVYASISFKQLGYQQKPPKKIASIHQQKLLEPNLIVLQKENCNKKKGCLSLCKSNTSLIAEKI